MRPILNVLCMVVCALAHAATVAAHELGTTRVVASVDDSNRYRLEIITDAGSLIEKLEAASGQPTAPAADMPPARLEARFAELEEVFDTRIALAFDGARTRPSSRIAVTPGTTTTPPVAAITLTGAVPAGARQLTWRYGWTFASYALSVKRRGGQETATEWLEGGQISRPIPLASPVRRPAATRLERTAARLRTAARYIALGFTHILPKGVDHVLFVLGLFLFARRARPLLAQVSAFTVAHSITLALSMYHVVRLPPSIVEPLIAVSIAYVAVENLVAADLTAWRIALVFAFGLLHGLGFAGALGELGLPRSEFVTALVGFNLGVEAGQLTVIAAAFAVVGWPWGGREWYRRLIVVPASAAIACIAVYWTVQRITWRPVLPADRIRSEIESLPVAEREHVVEDAIVVRKINRRPHPHTADANGLRNSLFLIRNGAYDYRGWQEQGFDRGAPWRAFWCSTVCSSSRHPSSTTTCSAISRTPSIARPARAASLLPLRTCSLFRRRNWPMPVVRPVHR